MSTIPYTLRESTYNPVGATGPWGVGFPIFDPTGAGLVVYLNGVEQTFGAVWTITPGTPETGFFGASTTWPNAVINSTIPLTGELVIKGVRDPRRVAQFNEGGGVPARDQNAELNILTAVDQELRRDVDREVAARISDVAALEAEQVVQNARLGSIDAEQVLQNGRLGTIDNSLVLQDRRIDALGDIITGVPFPADGLEFRPEQFPLVPALGRLQAAADAAWALGGALRLRSGVSYDFGLVDLKPGLIVRSAGAVWRHDGSSTGSQFALTVGAGVVFDEIVISTPGTETAIDLISIAADVQGRILWAKSDVQRAGGGIIAHGSARIEVVIARKIDRPWYFANLDTIPVDGGYVGFLDVQDYVRAFRADNCGFYLGGYRFVGKSPNASMAPGHNGFLIVGCRRWHIGEGYGADSGEHFIRIGGSAAGTATTDYTIADQYIVRSGGCALKINPTLLVSPGVTEKARRGRIGHIVAVDVGVGLIEGNKELARLSHVDDLKIASLTAWIDGAIKSAQYGVQANDCRKVRIGGLGGTAINAGMVYFWSGSDVDGVNTFGGDIDDFQIEKVWGNCAGNNAITVDMGAFSLSRVEIDCDRLDGHAVNVMRWLSGNLTGRFAVTGSVIGPAATQGLPDNDNMLIDLERAGKRRQGRAANARHLASFSSSNSGLDLGATPADGKFGTIFAGALGAVAGDGAYGGSFMVGRPGSDRRGAGIAALQSGVSGPSIGLAILATGTGTTGSDAVALHSFFRPDGDLELSQVGKGYRAKSPDGTNYRLAPPNGGGTANWIAA